MVGDNGKQLKTSIDDESEVIVFVEKLQEIQDELEKINEKASDEALELEKKYNEIRKPVYKKRNEIVKSIADFWMTAFLSHPSLCDYLNPEDRKIFRHLTTIEVEDSKDLKSGYSITFNFSANPYFEDTKLTKTFNFLDEGTTKVTSTSIQWKDGMKEANGGKKGNKRALDDQSFFSWFDETEQSEDEFDDEIAEVIREDLWPNPLHYINAEAEADEQEYEGDEEDEEGW